MPGWWAWRSRWARRLRRVLCGDPLARAVRRGDDQGSAGRACDLMFELALLSQPAEEAQAPHVRLAHALDEHLEVVVVSIRHLHRQLSSHDRSARARR